MIAQTLSTSIIHDQQSGRYRTPGILRIPTTLIGIVLFVQLQISAQSIDELISLARQNNPTLKASHANYQAASQGANQVSAYPDPQLGFGFGVLPVETRLGAQRMQLGLSQRLLWKGEIDAKRSLEDARAEILSSDADEKTIDLAFIIKRSYFSLIHSDKLIAHLERKIQTLEVLEEMTTNAIEAGPGRLSNVLLVQRKKEEVRSMMNEVEIGKRFHVIEINRALGRDPDIEVNVSESGIEEWENAVAADQAIVESEHPGIRKLQNSIDLSMRSIDLIEFQKKPKVIVGLEYMMVDKRPQITLLNNGRDVLMPMGSISIPIHKSQYKAREQQERLRIDALKSTIESKRVHFSAEIAAAKNKVLECEEVIKRNENLLQLTSGTIELLRTEYINDGGRFYELLQLEMDQIDYDWKIDGAIRDRRIALAIIDKYGKI